MLQTMPVKSVFDAIPAPEGMRKPAHQLGPWAVHLECPILRDARIAEARLDRELIAIRMAIAEPPLITGRLLGCV